jgi:hypothetical protein
MLEKFSAKARLDGRCKRKTVAAREIGREQAIYVEAGSNNQIVSQI